MKTKAVTGIVIIVLLIGMLALTFSIDGGYVLALGYWAIETVDDTGDVGQWNSLALDSGDHPHISYYDWGNSDLKYAYRDDVGTWHTDTVDSGNAGFYTSIAVDSGDHPHISYYDGTYQYLKYAYGSQLPYWDILVVDPYYETGFGTSIAIDSGDRPHISCGSARPDYVGLKHVYRDDGVWQREMVDTGNVAQETSIVVDSGDHPHISYFFRTSKEYSDLKYAYHDGSTWHIETVYSGNVVDTSIAVDSGDRPHILYKDLGATTSDLKYAYHDGSTWRTETVYSGNVVGASIALGSGDRPHISYGDGTDGALKYAYRDDVGTWHTDTVYSGDVGDTSIALDSGNYPHISYGVISEDHSHLKYAYYFSPIMPVGGVRVPVDKFGLLAPYIGLASTILVATVASAIYVKRVKHREEKQ